MSPKAAVRFLAASALILLVGAACVLFAWNYFVTVVSPTMPKLTFVQSLAGMVLLSTVRGVWCCGSSYFYALPRL